MNLTPDPLRASVQTDQPSPAKDPGQSTVLGKARMDGGSVLTARRWSAVMAPLIVMSVVLLLICLQFGTQWIGLTQIIDIVGQALREGTVESEHIGTTEIGRA